MSAAQTGGPAFPQPWINDGDRPALSPAGHSVGEGLEVVLPGMTIRDVFADGALRSMLSLEQNVAVSFGSKTEKLKLALAAYSYADAMLEARKK